MPNWNSPEVQQGEAIAFVRLQHVLAGLYFWEFATSLDFDWSTITRKRTFSWAMIFYFANRYCLLFALIGLLLSLDVTETQINCTSLLAFVQFAGDASVGLSSINLAIRTMAIWKHSRRIVIPLVVLILGHWSLILMGVIVQTKWLPGTGCSLISTNHTVLSIMFLYSVCFDFLVLILSAWKLYDSEWKDHSQIAKILFKDGLVYFAVAFVFNLIAAVFMLLHLNVVMGAIFSVPAATASTIVACRSVRRLFKLKDKKSDLFLSPRMPSARNHNDFAGTETNGSIVFAGRANTASVHVQIAAEQETEEEESKSNRKLKGMGLYP